MALQWWEYFSEDEKNCEDFQLAKCILDVSLPHVAMIVGMVDWMR